MPPVVAVAQLPGCADDASAREAAIVAAVRGADADLVVLPEAGLPGYRHDVAEAGPRARALALDLAAEGRHVALGYLSAGGCRLGLATPDGRWTTYQKRVPSPAEARAWTRGDASVVVETALGRIGLAICGDVLFRDTWAPWVGRVDVVAVAAAWPDYGGRRDPIGRWLGAEGTTRRDAVLAGGARWTGATVAFADACGGWRGQERFTAGSQVVHPDGRVVRVGPGVGTARAAATTAPPGEPWRHPARWRAFLSAYRAASRLAPREG